MIWNGATAAQTALKPCQKIEFRGEVSEKQPFEIVFGGGLAFRLRPELHPANPPGWTIEILRTEDKQREHDYLTVATPPYRFFNPRDLTVSYDYNAEQIVRMDVRPFNFVWNEAGYGKLSNAVDTLLWSYNHSKAEIARAQKTFDEMIVATGELHILDSKIEGMEQGQRGRITWLKFTAQLCVPCDFIVAPGLKTDRSACGTKAETKSK